MSKINVDWFVDEVAYDLENETDLDRYTSAVERDIETKALIEGVRVDEIPVDGVTGYYTSRIVISYAALLYKKYLFFGYWGSSDGDTGDIYEAKLMEVKEQIRQLEPKISYHSILGLEEEDGTPKGKMAVAKVIPMSGGAPMVSSSFLYRNGMNE